MDRGYVSLEDHEYQEDFYFVDENTCEWCGEDLWECVCNDDKCCFHPLYTGEKGSCRCKEYAEENGFGEY